MNNGRWIGYRTSVEYLEFRNTSQRLAFSYFTSSFFCFARNIVLDRFTVEANQWEAVEVLLGGMELVSSR